MNASYTLKAARKKFPALVNQAERGRFARIKAMKAIHDAERGKGKPYPASALLD